MYLQYTYPDKLTKIFITFNLLRTVYLHALIKYLSYFQGYIPVPAAQTSDGVNTAIYS